MTQERVEAALRVLDDAERGVGDWALASLVEAVREALQGPSAAPRTIAVVHRAPNGPDVYWGPFRDGDAVRAWAEQHGVRCGYFEVKDPTSDPREWWL